MGKISNIIIGLGFTLILLVCLVLVLQINSQSKKEIPCTPTCPNIVEVTSICVTYAESDFKSFDPLTKIYTFSGMSVHEDVLLASCEG